MNTRLHFSAPVVKFRQRLKSLDESDWLRIIETHTDISWLNQTRNHFIDIVRWSVTPDDYEEDPEWRPSIAFLGKIYHDFYSLSREMAKPHLEKRFITKAGVQERTPEEELERIRSDWSYIDSGRKEDREWEEKEMVIRYQILYQEIYLCLRNVATTTAQIAAIIGFNAIHPYNRYFEYWSSRFGFMDLYKPFMGIIPMRQFIDWPTFGLTTKDGESFLEEKEEAVYDHYHTH
jgi:hypothetical protein